MTPSAGRRDYGATLWDPTEPSTRDARITGYPAGCAHQRRGSGRLRRAVAVVGGRARPRSGPRSGTTSTCSASAGTGRCWPAARCPTSSWFAGTTLNYARNALRRPRTASRTGPRSIYRVRGGPERARSATRELARRGGQGARGPARRSASTAGDRVAAYLPNIPEALIAPAGHRQPRRDLDVLLAGLRRAQRDRPVRPDRAQGADRGRRLRLRRQAVRPAAEVAAIAAALPGLEALVTVDYARSRGQRATDRQAAGAARPGRAAADWARCPRRRRGGRRSSPRCRSSTRCGCCTPRAPPGCPSRSCTATAASCWSTSRRSALHQDLGAATSSSGTPPPAG